MRNGKDTATWILPRRAGEGDRVAVEGARGAPCPLRLARSVLATSPASQGRSQRGFTSRTSCYLPLVGRSKNASGAQRFSGGGPLFVAGTAPHPDRFALRPPHKGEVRIIASQQPHPLFTTRHSLFAIYPGGPQQ